MLYSFMSKFVKNFLIESLYASGILLLAKLIGIIGALYVTGSPFTIETGSASVPTIGLTLANPANLFQVNSISNLFFTIIVIIFATFNITRIYFTTFAKKHPKVQAKIIYYNLIDWLENGEKSYPKLFTWAIYMWLGAILVLRDSILGISWNQLPIVFIIFAAFYSVLIFMQLDKHIEIISFHKENEHPSAARH